MTHNQRLLVVDDSPGVCDLIRDVAEDLGYEVQTVMARDDFEAVFTAVDPTLITLDLQLTGGDGIEVLRYLADYGSTASIIVISGFDTRVVSSALRIGQTHGLRMLGSLRKPFSVQDLERLLLPSGQRAFEPVAADLRTALEQGEIVPFFQPKACLVHPGGPAICETEALARWQHPEHGLISPAQFVPLAESTGLILPLTWGMAEQCARQLAQWRAQGMSLSVAINIAPAVVQDLDYPDHLAALVTRAGAQPDWFTLEITESGAMRDSERAMDILTRLRLKGFNLSCDDFGTGYSSLVQLYRMPFCELKIDRSFVADCIEQAEARVIIRACIELGHSLGLTVCAEGVETQDVFDFLRIQGCDSIQGYHVGYPVPAADLPELVRVASLQLLEIAAP
ncbi:EAL domain-containing response regulator [Marichromatium bheemlicum]|uniref:EAL domain-containing response regulator n=1 Tax=Marichromatium bheemlicum TaxID=365339 RepID=A0ABX1I7B6_9GAMM|nr:EAL domain-containing response regulator [Marichromatium bheemlicum]NKN33470.1 EAL domain-containing response regulator [Marichromatium bheemlicum]